MCILRHTSLVLLFGISFNFVGKIHIKRIMNYIFEYEKQFIPYIHTYNKALCTVGKNNVYLISTIDGQNSLFDICVIASSAFIVWSLCGIHHTRTHMNFCTTNVVYAYIYITSSQSMLNAKWNVHDSSGIAFHMIECVATNKRINLKWYPPVYIGIELWHVNEQLHWLSHCLLLLSVWQGQELSVEHCMDCFLQFHIQCRCISITYRFEQRRHLKFLEYTTTNYAEDEQHEWPVWSFNYRKSNKRSDKTNTKTLAVDDLWKVNQARSVKTISS